MSASEVLVQPADGGVEEAAAVSPRQTEPVLGAGEIQPQHGERLAIADVRQSSPQQVLEHRESAALQYDLKRRAAALGWPPDRVVALDELTMRQVLRVVEPASLELSLQAAQDSRRERDRLQQHGRQRLGRARYESDRAARQYHDVEPENRLVARQLEHRWEESLRGQRAEEEASDRFLQEQPPELTVAECESNLALAADLPALLEAPTTTTADRQAIVRHWVEKVVVESQAGRMVRTGRYKYVVYESGRHREQLTDLSTEPGEMTNLRKTRSTKTSWKTTAAGSATGPNTPATRARNRTS
jgi:hypothetical protein